MQSLSIRSLAKVCLPRATRAGEQGRGTQTQTKQGGNNAVRDENVQGGCHTSECCMLWVGVCHEQGPEAHRFRLLSSAITGLNTASTPYGTQQRRAGRRLKASLQQGDAAKEQQGAGNKQQAGVAGSATGHGAHLIPSPHCPGLRRSTQHRVRSLQPDGVESKWQANENDSAASTASQIILYVLPWQHPDVEQGERLSIRQEWGPRLPTSAAAAAGWRGGAPGSW